MRTILIALALIAPALLCRVELAEARQRKPALVLPAGFVFHGKASFYGRESGPKTASGERFDENGLTCAHRELAFGTRLAVSWRGRRVVCRVNDRGPFIAGRVLDLSTAAARAIGMLGAGVADVTIEVR